MAEIIIGLIILKIGLFYYDYQSNRKPTGNLTEEEIKRLFDIENKD